MEKNSHLKDLQALGPLEIIGARLDEEGSFDDAVSGCDYAFLVAAPVTLLPENPEVSNHHHTTVLTSLRLWLTHYRVLSIGNVCFPFMCGVRKK